MGETFKKFLEGTWLSYRHNYFLQLHEKRQSNIMMMSDDFKFS
jgi:hypothetical protein